jgi:hypothetical protein
VELLWNVQGPLLLVTAMGALLSGATTASELHEASRRRKPLLR